MKIDVTSFELNDFHFPGKEGIDKPFIISEFNFGALDVGKFYPGLGHASSQRNRGEKYKNFQDHTFSLRLLVIHSCPSIIVINAN